MADEVVARPTQCPRCGHAVRPRGGVPARYCAICGFRLRPLHVEVQDALATRARARGAVAALVLGLLACIPLCGLPFGPFAIGLGLCAKERIRQSAGRLGGNGMATAGIVLGVIMTALWGLAWLHVG